MELKEVKAEWHIEESKMSRPGWLIPLSQFPYLASFMKLFHGLDYDKIGHRKERNGKAALYYMTLEEFQLLTTLNQNPDMLDIFEHDDIQAYSDTTYRDIVALPFKRSYDEYMTVTFDKQQWYGRWEHILSDFQDDVGMADLRLRYIQARDGKMKDGDLVVMSQVENKELSTDDNVVLYINEYAFGYVNGVLKPFGLMEGLDYVVPPVEFTFPEYPIGYWERDEINIPVYMYVNFENKELFSELEDTPLGVPNAVLEQHDMKGLEYSVIKLIYRKQTYYIYFFSRKVPSLDDITAWIQNPHSIYWELRIDSLATVIPWKEDSI